MTSKPHSELEEFIFEMKRAGEYYGFGSLEIFTDAHDALRNLEEQLETREAVVRAARKMAEAWEGIGWDDRTKNALANVRYQLSRLDSNPAKTEGPETYWEAVSDSSPATSLGKDEITQSYGGSSPAKRPT